MGEVDLRREATDHFGCHLDVSSRLLRVSKVACISLSIWGPRHGFHRSYEFVDISEAKRLRDKLNAAIDEAERLNT